MALKIRLHERNVDIKKSATWKRLRKLVDSFIRSKEQNLNYWFNQRNIFKRVRPSDDSLWYIGFPYACPMMVFHTYSVYNRFDGLNDAIAWDSSSRKYTPERGPIKSVTRAEAIDCIIAAIYKSYENSLDTVKSINDSVWRKIYIMDKNLVGFVIVYDGNTYDYRTNTGILDKIANSSKDVSSFRKATPSEISDPSIEWVMYGTAKYGRKMVNYNLGIWRPLTESEFYGSGVVD